MPPSSLTPTLTRPPDELRRGFSLLRTRQDLADLLEIPDSQLVYMLYWGRHHYPYRTFCIAKKSGGLREIAAPAPSLGIVQSKLKAILELIYTPKSVTHGFVPSRGILSNALRHTGKRFVLNVDLQDFFPSINFGRVRGMFMARPYELPPAVATVLAQICCHDNQLPQGAPTSPIVSNMIASKLDSQLNGLAREHRCLYTRYADDLTFSTARLSFPGELADPQNGWCGSSLKLGTELVSVIESNGFRVNPRKQRLQLRGQHQEVTGVTVNKFPNVSRTFVRQIRAMIHACERYGLDEANREFRDKYDRRSRVPGTNPPHITRVIRGKLDFLAMLKGPGDAVYRRLAHRLHMVAPHAIEDPPDHPPGGAHVPPHRIWQHWYEQYHARVFLVAIRKDDRELAGTGFVWHHKVFVTAAHNLDGDINCPALTKQDSYTRVTFYAHPNCSAGVDAAIVLLPQDAPQFRGDLPISTAPPTPGEPVVALGYATIPMRQPSLGIYPGYVESITQDYGGNVQWIQVGIETAGGLSGAPVIDRGGRLVGIVTEQTFERTDDHDIPRRAFHHVLPARYLTEIDFPTD